MPEPLISIRNLTKTFASPRGDVQALALARGAQQRTGAAARRLGPCRGLSH